jgi:hypothetical protein
MDITQRIFGGVYKYIPAVTTVMPLILQQGGKQRLG